MTTTELLEQTARVNRSIELQRLSKPALCTALVCAYRAAGYTVGNVTFQQLTKQEIANRIIEIEKSR